MRLGIMLCVVGCVAWLLVGCSDTKYQEGEQLAHRPIHCATAEGDIRALQHEKAHVQDQIIAGASSVTPAGAAMGLVMGHEVENLKVATGEYNKMLDKRIAQIKDECGLE